MMRIREATKTDKIWKLRLRLYRLDKTHVVAWLRALNKHRTNLLNNLRKLIKSNSQTSTRSGSSQITEKLLFDDHNIVNSDNIIREKTLQNSTTGIWKFIKKIREKWKS